MSIQLDEFERAYFEAALWTAELDEHSIDEIDERHIENSKKELAAFRASDAYKAAIETGLWTEAQAGHDFWLTRNHHGAGFWDRYREGAGGDLGKALTDLSEKYSEIYLYREEEESGLIRIAIEGA
jgi:hypothetical protein